MENKEYSRICLTIMERSSFKSRNKKINTILINYQFHYLKVYLSINLTEYDWLISFMNINKNKYILRYK